MEAVSDAGPLIAWTQLGLLRKGVALFDRVLVPPAVVAELRGGLPRPDAAALLEALKGGALQACKAPRPLPFALPASLGTGERQVLAAAAERRVAVLVDDRIAFRTASALGLPAIGTGRLLLMLVKAGELAPAEFEAALHRLAAQGFRLDARAFAALLEEARRLSRG